MQIKQGSTAPIVLTFDTDVSTASAISILLHDKYARAIKRWSEAEIIITDERSILLPLTEAETMGFPSGRAWLTAKMLDSDGDVIFFGTIECDIAETADKRILGGGA